VLTLAVVVHIKRQFRQTELYQQRRAGIQLTGATRAEDFSQEAQPHSSLVVVLVLEEMEQPPPRTLVMAGSVYSTLLLGAVFIGLVAVAVLTMVPRVVAVRLLAVMAVLGAVGAEPLLVQHRVLVVVRH